MKDKFCITCGYNLSDFKNTFKTAENQSGKLFRFLHLLCPKCWEED